MPSKKCSVSKPISNASQATHTNLNDCSGNDTVLHADKCYKTKTCGSGDIKKDGKCITGND